MLSVCRHLMEFRFFEIEVCRCHSFLAFMGLFRAVIGSNARQARWVAFSDQILGAWVGFLDVVWVDSA